MASRPKINALNIERTHLLVQMILHAFSLIKTLMPPTPKLHAAIELFTAYARDFECFRATNYITVPGPSPVERAGSPIVASFSTEKTELGPDELLGR